MSILKTKPYKSVDAGQFHFDFYYKEGSVKDTCLEVTCDSGMFNCLIGGRSETYYFLLHVAMQNDTAVLHDYITRLYHLAMVWNDTELAKDVNTAIDNWHERVNAEAAEKAAAINDSEEMASQAFMEDVVAYAEASPKERERMSEEDRKEMKQILNEDSNGE